jgi:gliding motility-associated-like protein
MYADTGFTVTLTNGECMAHDTVFIHVNPLPELSLSASANHVQVGEQVNLEAITDGVSLLWSPSNYLSCITCPQTVSTPMDSVTYLVAAFSVDGCRATDTISIAVDILCDQFFVPNLFSPNGDGNNDSFCFYGTDCIEKFHVQIFDRWGNKVFDSEDRDVCWDGSYKSKLMDPGVYVYKVEAYTYQKKILNRNGNVTLIR